MKSLFCSESGEVDIPNVIYAVVAVVIAGILVGALLPSATNGITLNQDGDNYYIGGVNVSQGTGDNAGVGNWSTSMRSTWSSIPILEVLAALIVFVIIIIKLSKG